MIVVLCVSLSACGGGGTETARPLPPPPQEPPPSSYLDEFTGQLQSESAGTVILGRAATNTPRAGSVTQSSNGDGTTLDSVSVVASQNDDGSNRFVVTNTEGAQWSIDSNTAKVRTLWSDEDGVAFALRKADAEGTLHVNVGREENLLDERYHFDWGFWLYYPADTNDPTPIVGAFSDAADPFIQNNLATLTGTAVYRGDAIAVGHFTSGDQTVTAAAEITGDVTLIADFGDPSALGTISGSLNVTSNSLDDPEDEGDPDPELRFEPAIIGSSNSGFFTSNVTYVGGDDITNWSGKWGGQFFGNPSAGSANVNPEGVHGTFGVDLTWRDGNTGAFAGQFHALSR